MKPAMKPRNLRHSLEKAAKILVLVHKHTPEVRCQFHQDRGEDGHLVIDFEGSGMSRGKMAQLGKDLESKGYRFTEKKSPWLGQTTFHGRAEGKPSVLLTLPIVKDRLAINEKSPERSVSFGDT